MTADRYIDLFLDQVTDAVDRPPWHRWARCSGRGADLFYPDPATAAAIATARRVCAGCQVVEECRAASVGERDGIWAGELHTRNHRRPVAAG
jgi:WhiB family redox-sensing transcriptional regulator